MFRKTKSGCVQIAADTHHPTAGNPGVPCPSPPSFHSSRLALGTVGTFLPGRRKEPFPECREGNGGSKM